MNDDFMLWSSNNDYEANLIADIEVASAVYLEQVAKAKREAYIRDALRVNYVDHIREHVSRYDMVNIIALAQNEVGIKLKKDRPNLETLKRWLLEDFLNGDKTFKIDSIVSRGYESYGWQISLTGHGKRIYIDIPVVKQITTKNIEYARYGMFGFGVHESKSYMRTLKESYSMKTIAGAIKDYFKEENNEN